MQCPPVALKSNLSRTAPASDVVQDSMQATLSEVFSDNAVDGAITGFTLAHLAQSDKPLLWIQDRLSRREAGRPYLPGLPVKCDVIHVDVSKPVDVLWAMEEGLRCSALCAIIGEVWGDPPALDFTATKRLAMRAEAQNVPAWLMRRGATANLSAARMRWRVASLPSQAKPYDSRAPGAPLWQAELFRARWRAPGQWVASHDTTGLHLAHGLDHATPHHAQYPQQATG
ncbi:ImuA family protein [Yoonia sp. 208BN28-4]|uniref:ImuA family protein n=1 Tax=Yoonia sp. 208BN28-4 TaxID=3126505 RepID=UPI0030B0B7A2